MALAMRNTDARVREVPPDLLELAKAALAEHGATRAAEELGISRATLLGIVAGTPVMPGSIALLREAKRNRGVVA